MRKLHIAILALVAVHALVIFAGFFAPCSPTEQHRELAYVPPMRLHLIDAQSHLHLHPFVYAPVATEGDGFQYGEDRSKAYPIRVFVRNANGRHLLGVDQPGNLFLMGTDGYGRDLFSRVLFGGRVSLAAAFLAMALSLSIGAFLGSIAGHFGGFADAAIMRAAELMLAVPWLCLLLAIRAFLPLHISPAATLFLVSGVIGTVNWARPARLVRGAVLSAKERGFVTSARGFGASEWYLLRRHVLPQTFGLLITQAIILLPTFVLAETILSFLGLGIEESLPSWGNMLAALQQFGVIASYWWMAAPILGLVSVSFTYFLLANVLEQTNIRKASGETYA
jgi:peptide/nickel transport system permease protein